jgi:hypothetical protein
VLISYRAGVTDGKGRVSVVMCAAVTVMFWYRVWETNGNGKGRVVMCAAVNVIVFYRVGVKAKWKRFSVNVCCI